MDACCHLHGPREGTPWPSCCSLPPGMPPHGTLGELCAGVHPPQVPCSVNLPNQEGLRGPASSHRRWSPGRGGGSSLSDSVTLSLSGASSSDIQKVILSGLPRTGAVHLHQVKAPPLLLHAAGCSDSTAGRGELRPQPGSQPRFPPRLCRDHLTMWRCWVLPVTGSRLCRDHLTMCPL